MSDDLESRVLTRTDASPSNVLGQEPDQVPHRRLNPTHLAYLMGPAAFVVILLLMKFDLVVRESAWLWLAVFITVPAVSFVSDALYSAQPSPFRLHARVAVQAAAVTTVIYLSGWGPVLSGAFAFLALENVAHGGSRVWRITALWSLVGIVVRAGGHHRRMVALRVGHP